MHAKLTGFNHSFKAYKPAEITRLGTFLAVIIDKGMVSKFFYFWINIGSTPLKVFSELFLQISFF